MTQRLTTALFALLTATGFSTIGCSGDEPSKPRAPLGSTPISMRRAASCADLDAMLRADALAKMNARIDGEIDAINRYGDEAGGGMVYDDSAPTASGAAGASANGAPKASQDGATAHSDTNTQVAGVDEADIVKTDGKRVFLLHGRTLDVVSAWPAEKLGIESSIEIDGMPLEMFVEGDRAVVYSTVDGTSVYAAAGVTPRSPYAEYGGYYGGGGDVAMPSAAPGYPGGGYYPTSAPLTKVTVLSLASGAPTVAAEWWFEGNYASSRRVGADVRTVLTGGAHGPALPGYPSSYGSSKSERIDAWEQVRARSTEILNASTHADWIPTRFSKVSGKVTAEATACEDHYVPSAGSSLYGMTQVASLDWTQPDTVRAASIVGQASTVYGSESSIVVASPAYLDFAGWQQWVTSPVTMSSQSTHLHRFDLSGGAPTYAGSATVAGAIKDQFAIDEKAGVLRVAYTEDHITIMPPSTSSSDSAPAMAPMAPSTVSRITTFSTQSAEGGLVKVASTPDLAPGERIYSARFVGDRGYVVTFRQVDPLFVVDLADPAKPTVLGELTIPGFSEYMHPLGDGYLLTIGRAGGNGGSAVAVQIFDVREPTSPKLAHKFAYPTQGQTEAAYEHKAFTYFADKKLLAFPYVAYAGGMPQTTLELFSVDVDKGLTKLGSVDHSPFFATQPQGYGCGYYGVGVRRGIFLDDVVVSVSYGGVIASKVAQEPGPMPMLAKLPLPAPSVPAYYGCGGI